MALLIEKQSGRAPIPHPRAGLVSRWDRLSRKSPGGGAAGGGEATVVYAAATLIFSAAAFASGEALLGLAILAMTSAAITGCRRLPGPDA